MVALIYLLFIAVVFYWQTRVVKAGKITKRKAIGLYAGYTIAPVILYGALFLALVGLEELTDTAIISEGYARSLFFVIVCGMAVVLFTTFAFSFVVLAMKTSNSNAP